MHWEEEYIHKAQDNVTTCYYFSFSFVRLCVLISLTGNLGYSKCDAQSVNEYFAQVAAKFNSLAAYKHSVKVK